MLFNLKESGESAEEIKRDDGAKLKEIARIMYTNFEALKTIRIGKKETGKTHPLQVIFQSCEKRNAALSKAKNIRTSNEEMAKKLGDQNGSDTKAMTGGNNSLQRETNSRTRKVSNAHMDHQKRQNTKNQED